MSKRPGLHPAYVLIALGFCLLIGFLVLNGRQVSSVFSTVSMGLSEGGAASGGMIAAAPTAAPAPVAPAPRTEATSGPVAEMEAISAPASSGGPSDSTTAGSSEAGSSSSASSVEPRYPEGQVASLKAGEIDDNGMFSDYLSYLSTINSLPVPVRSLDVRERYLIKVMDENQRPLLDARVRIYDGEREIFEGRTTAGGRTIFLPAAVQLGEQTSNMRIVAELGDARGETTLQRGGSEQIELAIRGATPEEQLRLDLLFMLDTTGSMDDELSRIQDTINDIAQRIDGFTPRPAIRWGLVAYKDYGDEYVTRDFPFTDDLEAFRAALQELQAGGGGDTPEAVDEALYVATERMEWSDNAVRLIFLVADAAPHVNYAGPYQVENKDFDYLDGTRIAVARGIKIYPIAASNTDQQAEFVFRQLAQQTLGRFIFLTYQPGASSGAPGESTTLNAGNQPYTVEALDDLIVGVVERELGEAVGAR
jgi:Mg-chelatase subunit ChlD